jgi:hypothetical protein
MARDTAGKMPAPQLWTAHHGAVGARPIEQARLWGRHLACRTARHQRAGERSRFAEVSNPIRMIVV